MRSEHCWTWEAIFDMKAHVKLVNSVQTQKNLSHFSSIQLFYAGFFQLFSPTLSTRDGEEKEVDI